MISDSLDKASYAYPGWGLADWWTDRYVELSCEDLSPDKSCAEGKPWAAVTVNPNKDFGYPLICFCDGFFNVLPSLADADAKIDNDDKKLNVGRLKSRGMDHYQQGTAVLANSNQPQRCFTNGFT